MIAAGALAMSFHYGCSLYCGKRCEPGRLILFAGRAAAVVAGRVRFLSSARFDTEPKQLAGRHAKCRLGRNRRPCSRFLQSQRSRT
jgi:hypothetical protein